ncbi:MAG: ubiquinol-cytochrome c reductase iron-sulfur subunit [Pseudomonadota bacterium]
MSNMSIDASKRRFLVNMTGAVGGVAAAGTAIPFVISMMPSARAKAAGAPVEVDLAKIEPGMMLTVEWRGKPVWVVNRTPEMLAALSKNDSKLTDPASEVASQQPDYCKNPTRSINPQYMVVVGICTHLGCSPTYRKEVAPADLGPDWNGGWFCPCHGSRFDLAARVYNGSPAPTNLVIPPHKYLTESKVLIGEDQAA